MTRPRVLVADDHTMLVEAFRKLLEDECEIVGTVADGRALVEAADALQPDVVIVDVSMPLMNGIEAAREVKRRHPGIRIIFVTMVEDPDVAAEAFRAGAAGYLLKRSAASELVTAVHEVMKERSYVTPLVTAGLIDSLQSRDATAAHVLTPRQREVIRLIAEGHSMREVAVKLGLTERTVAFHKYRIMKQLGLASTAELVRYAIKQGLI